MNPRETHSGLIAELPAIAADAGRRLPHAAVSFSDERSMQLWTTGSRSGMSAPAPDGGVVLRVWDGAGFVEFGTNRAAPGDVRKWALARAGSVSIRGDAPPPAPRSGARRDFDSSSAVPHDSVGIERKLGDVADLQRKIRAIDPRVVNARVAYEETRVFKAYADRDRFLTQDLSFTGASFIVYASGGGRTCHASGGNKRCGGYEVLGRVASDEALSRTVGYACDMLRAGKVPPGMHTIVTSPNVSATVAHEAFGHGVEMDMFAKGCSRAGEFVGRQVASPLVSMYDSPDLPDSAGFSFFDDEGELSRTTAVIEAGILKSGLTDAYTALKLGSERTPNGRRENFRRKVYSRMTNTYFAPGDRTREDIIAMVDDGVYLCGGGVGMEDPLGWGMQIDVRLGYEIAGGRLTGRVYSPVGLTGYVPDLLRSIRAVGSDLETHGAGKCGKTFRKDWIPVGMGGPTLLMEGRLA